jgi:hypothetical protein
VIRPIAAISGIYDGAVGLFLLLAADRMAAIFGVAPPQPPIFGNLNGLFLVAVGVGYYWPYRDPRAARWYMWVMGVGLKSAGALAFVLDYSLRHSPSSFLLFAGSDGSLAVLTLIALARDTRSRVNSTTPQLHNTQLTPNTQVPKRPS